MRCWRDCRRRRGFTPRSLPIILYAVFGTSRALAVGPVAVVSLMTAAAVGNVAEQGTVGYAVAALTLALLSGAILLAMGLLRLGFLANFLSHPVIAGFITASGILIAASQIKHILGVTRRGRHAAGHACRRLAQNLPATNWITLAIGVSAAALPVLGAQGAEAAAALARAWRRALPMSLTKAGPVAAVVATTLAVWGLGLDARGVADRGRGAAGPAAADAAVVLDLI